MYCSINLYFLLYCLLISVLLIDSIITLNVICNANLCKISYGCMLLSVSGIIRRVFLTISRICSLFFALLTGICCIIRSIFIRSRKIGRLACHRSAISILNSDKNATRHYRKSTVRII